MRAGGEREEIIVISMPTTNGSPEIIITSDGTRMVGITREQAYIQVRPARWVNPFKDNEPAPVMLASDLNAALAKRYLGKRS